MLLGNDFVKAHHEYKREVLRNSYQARQSTKVEKAIIALVASAVAVMAAIGF